MDEKEKQWNTEKQEMEQRVKDESKAKVEFQPPSP